MNDYRSTVLCKRLPELDLTPFRICREGKQRFAIYLFLECSGIAQDKDISKLH